MNRTPSALLLAVLAAASLAAASVRVTHAAPPPPPATPVSVVRDTLHGAVFEDPYRWLEDKDIPETRAWVREQNTYTQARLAEVPGRDQVTGLLARYSRLDARTQPTVRGGRLFFLARTAEQQQSVLVMSASANAPDRVLADPNPLAADHSVSVSLENVSLDGRWIAYSIRKGGEDETDVRFMDVDTGKDLPGGLPKARYFGIAIDAAKQGCWYSRWEPKGSRVWYHRFSDDPSKDTMIFGDGLGPVEIPEVQLSPNGRWLSVTVFKGSASRDTRVFVRSSAAGGAFASLTDTLHALVNTGFAGDRIVIRTDWNAPNGRLMVTEAATPGLAHWKPLVPERTDAVLEGFSVCCGRVFAEHLHDVVAEVSSYDMAGKPLGTVPLPGIGSASAPAGEWEAKEAYWSFASFNRPTTIERWDAATGTSSEWWRSAAPIRSDDYDVKQVWYTSKDGTRVPMFVAARKGLALDGTHPVLLTGYGGFNLTETPAFSPRVAAWLDLGGVYALANLRGGGEYGERWHRDGMLERKQHTFDDFIAASEWLIAQKYCTAKTLAIMGGSNGGLLVGAAMTQRPDLYGAVLCEIPLLDMLRYHRFLIARFWVPEYGSSEDAEQFGWLRAYSPYQNVKPGVTYPPIMLVSGDSDTRVDPLHARKMTARLQSLNGPNPVWLHYDVAQGHSGGKSVDKNIEDTADDLQFLRAQLGMAK